MLGDLAKQLFGYLQEGDVVKAAPRHVFASVLLGATLGWICTYAWVSVQVANAKSEVQSLRGKIEVLEERLSYRGEELEDTRRRLSEEREKLNEALSKSPGAVTIHTPKEQSPLTKELKHIFERSGWTVDLEESGGPKVSVTGDDQASDKAVYEALKGVGLTDLYLGAIPKGDSPPSFSPAPQPLIDPSNSFKHLDRW